VHIPQISDVPQFLNGKIRVNVPYIQSNTVLYISGNLPLESFLHVSFNMHEHTAQFLWKYLEESAHYIWVNAINSFA
jgi:hypothetical protein